ncbi:GrpB family protein [Paracoccus jiaweipingae]|uniref:GrpB family protein n=1 Tax=unclassified Paracoccus (in: a-proteobacteria) TaxID=2688777 RepID=UPI0037A1AB95
MRQPDWHQHRTLRSPKLDVHSHVLSDGCEQIEKHLPFRNALRRDSLLRLDWQALKQKLAARV